jgi:hypothetical protein
MIQTRSVEPATKPVPIAFKAQPSEAAIVSNMASIINRLNFAGRTVDAPTIFLEGEGAFTNAEVEKHLPAACDRAIEMRRKQEAARRVA